MVKGWGGHREGTRFESQWGQRMKKRKKLFIYKKKIFRFLFVNYNGHKLQVFNIIYSHILCDVHN